jgi:hypothetical protein
MPRHVDGVSGQVGQKRGWLRAAASALISAGMSDDRSRPIKMLTSITSSELTERLICQMPMAIIGNISPDYRRASTRGAINHSHV